MAQFITGMDQHTKKQFGENLHAEYGISNELDEQIMQFFFQLVRNKDHSSLEMLHLKILRNIKHLLYSMEMQATYQIEFINLTNFIN